MPPTRGTEERQPHGALGGEPLKAVEDGREDAERQREREVREHQQHEGGTSPGSPSFRSEPRRDERHERPADEQNARGRDGEDGRDTPRRACSARLALVGGVVLGHEADEARGDAEIEEGEVGEDASTTHHTP